MLLTYNLAEIDTVAAKLLENSKSKTLLFYGEMGAGKTTLIKALVKLLGAEEPASSPTFSIVNEYEIKNGLIYHFDFYRIEDKNEALDIGLEDYLHTQAWKFVEWPQKIINFIEDDYQNVELFILENGARKLKLR